MGSTRDSRDAGRTRGRAARALPLLSLLTLGAAGCGEPSGDDDDATTPPEDAAWEWDLPPGFPKPRVPADNPMTAEKVELGRFLFYDTRLSGNQTQSCATCHEQALAFTDGLAHAEGSTGQIHRRSAMSLTNVVYSSALTWSSHLQRSLEDQALLPMFGETPVELGLAGMEAELLARLKADAEYQAMFPAAFPDETDPFSLSSIVKALAAFERTLISGNSAYDRYIYQRDTTALSAAALRGMQLFFSEKCECFHCHGSFNFADSVVYEGTVFDELYFHNTGLYNVDGAGGYPAVDPGLYELTGLETDMGRFRAPSLRNIELTAPYMHDGSIATLEEVLEHYAAGGRTLDGDNAGVGSTNPYKSEFVKGFTLTADEKADLIEFLKSLTDPTFITDPRFADPFAQE